jgi:dienelactone hydrolase
LTQTGDEFRTDCIDYLETRTDIDAHRIAYCGYSFGSILGPLLLTVENRIRTAVFSDGALIPVDLPRSFDFALYARRVTIPVLMINGHEDAIAPANGKLWAFDGRARARGRAVNG